MPRNFASPRYHGTRSRVFSWGHRLYLAEKKFLKKRNKCKKENNIGSNPGRNRKQNRRVKRMLNRVKRAEKIIIIYMLIAVLIIGFVFISLIFTWQGYLNREWERYTYMHLHNNHVKDCMNLINHIRRAYFKKIYIITWISNNYTIDLYRWWE